MQDGTRTGDGRTIAKVADVFAAVRRADLVVIRARVESIVSICDDSESTMKCGEKTDKNESEETDIVRSKGKMRIQRSE